MAVMMAEMMAEMMAGLKVVRMVGMLGGKMADLMVVTWDLLAVKRVVLKAAR